jgi:hypothetical protein
VPIHSLARRACIFSRHEHARHRCRVTSMSCSLRLVLLEIRRTIPKGQKTQPTTEPFAQVSLDQITGVISAYVITRAQRFKARR